MNYFVIVGLLVGAFCADGFKNWGYRAAIKDATFGYFGTCSFPATVSKIRLADMALVANFTARTDENCFSGATTDGTFGYFSTNNGVDYNGTFGAIIKIQLSDMTRIATYRTTREEAWIGGGVTDGNFVYFDVETASSAQVVKLRASDLMKVGAIRMPGTGFWRAFRVGNIGYFSQFTFPAKVVSIQLSQMSFGTNYSADPTSTVCCFNSAVRDGAFGYFGAAMSEGVVHKVDLATMKKVGAAYTDTGSYASALADGKFVYFGTATDPGRIVKIEVDELTVVGTFTGQPHESQFNCAVTDGKYGYFCCGSSGTVTGKIIKVDLSTMKSVANFSL